MDGFRTIRAYPVANPPQIALGHVTGQLGRPFGQICRGVDYGVGMTFDGGYVLGVLGSDWGLWALAYYGLPRSGMGLEVLGSYSGMVPERRELVNGNRAAALRGMDQSHKRSPRLYRRCAGIDGGSKV